MATMTKHKSWKSMRETGWDPTEGMLLSLKFIVRWLLAMTNTFRLRSMDYSFYGLVQYVLVNIDNFTLNVHWSSFTLI